MMVATILAYARYVVAFIGIFLGFYWLSNDAPLAVSAVTLINVGVVGLISFFSHVVFHKSDAQRLGWSAASPAFQFEVGFANLALALAAFLAVFGGWGLPAACALLVAYALYFLQVGGFFVKRYLDERSSRFVINIVAFFVMAGMMLFFAIQGMSAAGLAPF